MGTQQMLLIVVGIIVVGIAIAVAIEVFGSTSVESNRNAIVTDLQNFAADAVHFRTRPTTMGGGSGSYSGYYIPPKLQDNEDATFTPTAPIATPLTVTFSATSKLGYGTITAVCDSAGALTNFVYTGDFL